MKTLTICNCLAFLCLTAPFGLAQEKKRVDRDGTPLPERAVCRLGSKRFLHSDYIVSTAFSPDGTKFASASIGGQGIVWEWPSGKRLCEFPGGYLQFSPDGQFLAVRAQLHFTIVDVRTGESILKEATTSFPVFSKKRSLIAWTVAGNKVGVRDISANSKPRFLEREHTIWALGFDGEGELLAAEMHDKGLAVSNLDQGKDVSQLDVAGQGVRWVELTSDARRLAILMKKNQVTVFDLRTGKPCFPVSEVPEDLVPSVLRDDNKLLLLSDRHTTRGLLWNLEEAKAVSFLTGGRAGTGAFSPKGDLLATGGTNSPHAPLFWDTKTGQLTDFAPGHHSFVLCVAFSPDGKEAATCTSIRGDPFVRFWDTTTGKQLRKLEAFPGGARQVAFTPDGRHIVACGSWQESRDAGLWEADSLKHVRDFKGHRQGASALAISSDGKKLATVGEGNSQDTIVWDLETGKPLAKQPKSGHGVFLPGDRTLAGGGQVWDWESKRVWPARVSGTFSPDGWLVATINDSGLRVLEVLTGAEVWSDPAGKQASRGGLAFAPNGRIIAAGSGTGLVHLFDWSKEGGRLSFQGSETGPYHLVFSRDGTRLAGVDHSTPLIWNVADVVGRPLDKMAKVDANDLEAWVRLLSSTDGRKAYQAVWKLAAARDEAVAVLKGQLRRGQSNAKQIARWIADLDDDIFAKREKAALELIQIGDEARRPIELAIKDPRSIEQQRRLEKIHAKLGGVSVEKLSQIRTTMVLEQIASPAARETLRWLAGGDADAFLTQQADLALKRLK